MPPKKLGLLPSCTQHLCCTLNVSFLLQLAMTQTSVTCSAREALTQLRAAPTPSQASTPQDCPLQGLVTQALSPQALRTLAPQALPTQALMPQGEVDLELGPQAHQEQPGLTATSVSAWTILSHSTLFASLLCSFFALQNIYRWLLHRPLADSQFWLSSVEFLKLPCVVCCGLRTAFSAQLAK